MSSKTESELKFAPSTIYFFVESRSFASVYVPITCVPGPAYLSDTLAQVLQNFVNNARPGTLPHRRHDGLCAFNMSWMNN